MHKYVLPVAVLYLSGVTASWALPGSTLPQLTSPTDIVQVGSKDKNKGKSHKSHEVHHHHHYSDDYDGITSIMAIIMATATAIGRAVPWAALWPVRSGIARRSHFTRRFFSKLETRRGPSLWALST
jgi:UDP-N-acetylmuramyl pentapeptide phosphotransferase/UDP-N-acetylglucosamine-1-phosphate transferase